MYYTSHSLQSAYIVQQLLIDSLNELVVVFDQSNRRPSNQSQLELVDSGSGREIVRVNVRRGAEEIGGQLRSDKRAASFGLPVPNKRLSVIHSTHSDDDSIANQIVIRTELRIRVRVEQRGPIMRREHAKQNVQHLPIPRRRDFFALIRHNQQAFELTRHTRRKEYGGELLWVEGDVSQIGGAFKKLVRVPHRTRMSHQQTQRLRGELLVRNGLLDQFVCID